MVGISIGVRAFRESWKNKRTLHEHWAHCGQSRQCREDPCTNYISGLCATIGMRAKVLNFTRNFQNTATSRCGLQCVRAWMGLTVHKWNVVCGAIWGLRYGTHGVKKWHSVTFFEKASPKVKIIRRFVPQTSGNVLTFFDAL